jgi:hypothetical protein
MGVRQWLDAPDLISPIDATAVQPYSIGSRGQPIDAALGPTID